MIVEWYHNHHKIFYETELCATSATVKDQLLELIKLQIGYFNYFFSLLSFYLHQNL